MNLNTCLQRKVFADGFEEIFSFKVNRYALQKAIAEHGEIIRSVSIPYDQSRLDDILTKQACDVRASRPVTAGWKRKIDLDFAKRKK